MSKKFYNEFDRIYDEIKKFLENYAISKVLQDYFIKQFISFFYANLINNFFTNLTQEDVIEYDLPRGNIGKIKNKYKRIQKDIKLVFSLSLKGKRIDEEYYEKFKSLIQDDFPEFNKIISEIERKIDTKKAKKYIDDKKRDIKKIGKSKKDFNAFFITTAIETFLKKENCLPAGKKLDKIMKSFAKECLPKVSQIITKELKKTSREMLENQREFLKKFEGRLYKRWKIPLDLIECLIRISYESAEEHKNKLSHILNNTNNYKIEALLKIHTRALQISNEILVQLKAGYPDGANARWRSLHELSIISIFLLQNNNEVSKRYLDHVIMKKFKEAKDYRTYYKKLGYLPIERKEFNKLKKMHDKFISTYGNDFECRSGFEWIPPNILQDRNFRALEEHVKLDKLHVFYNLACNSVHGGARGFYRLGLIDELQTQLLLTGPSNYGLADPLQNTAISLLHITNCLLSIEPDFESLLQMNVMMNYVNEIGPKSVKVQEKIKKDTFKTN
jgi:hypothetical protein